LREILLFEHRKQGHTPAGKVSIRLERRMMFYIKNPIEQLAGLPPAKPVEPWLHVRRGLTWMLQIPRS
jgi:hypothetical protein